MGLTCSKVCQVVHLEPGFVAQVQADIFDLVFLDRDSDLPGVGRCADDLTSELFFYHLCDL